MLGFQPWLAPTIWSVAAQRSTAATASTATTRRRAIVVALGKLGERSWLVGSRRAARKKGSDK
uniref:Uncharacterized protein n=1 Tax=Arundo donax TaxID=35708 RepID=A0A0A9F481_ARUDO